MGPLSGGKTTGTWEAFYLIATLRFKAARQGGSSAQPVLAWLAAVRAAYISAPARSTAVPS